jgi:hypothetical protein
MSDDDLDPEPDGTDAEEGGEEPDLDGDDYVEVPDEVAEEVAAETTASTDDEDTDQDDDGAETDNQADPLTSGTSVGDVYCNALGMGATLARDSRGSGVDDRERQVDEYADMARQLDLDDFVNEWVEAHGGTDEMTPGQGIMVGTTMFAMAVLVEDPALADELGQEVGG